MRWILFNLPAQARHLRVDGPVERFEVPPACEVHQYLTSHNASGMLDEHAQHFEFAGRQANFFSGRRPEFTPRQIQTPTFKAENLAIPVLNMLPSNGGAATQRDPDPGK